MSRVVINADLGKTKINRHIYGHFSEHLGRCIYGGYWVGEDSPIPNTRGIRNDIVEALRKIKIPNLRWPGGCFADEYHWMDGIGPRDKRPTMINTTWGMVTEDNHFGTHEFFDLCEQLDTEPYICGNLGSGTVREMQNWIEYITFDGKSPMADLRRQNGRKDPWKIKFWGIGNESWGCGGTMRPEYYADLFRQYNTYCRNMSGHELYRIACGAYNDFYKWTEVLMREIGWRMHGLSLHYYVGFWDVPPLKRATDFDEDGWFISMKKGYWMEELVTRHSTIMDQYDPDKKTALVVDEWGMWHNVEPGTNPAFLYQQNTLRDALVAGLTLDIFNNHADRVRMANLAQTVNVLQAVVLTEGEKMILTPTYHVFDMYKVHQDATLLPMDLEAGKYEHKGQSIPAMIGSASRNEAGMVHLSLCNLDPDRGKKIECTVRGMTVSKAEATILTASDMNAHNTFEHPNHIHPTPFDGITINDGTIDFHLPAKSVVVMGIS